MASTWTLFALFAVCIIGSASSMSVKVEVKGDQRALLVQSIHHLRRILAKRNADIEALKKSLNEQDRKLIEKYTAKVAVLKKSVEQSVCCESKTNAIESNKKSITILDKTVSQVKCPKPWAQHNGLCFKEFTNSKNWYKARDHCEEIGGMLATIPDKETSDFLMNGKSDMIWNVKNGHWVGLSDHKKEGDYRWADGSKATYMNWHPSWANKNREPLDCTDYFPSDGTLRDYNCLDTDQYVCQASPLALMNKN